MDLSKAVEALERGEALTNHNWQDKDSSYIFYPNNDLKWERDCTVFEMKTPILMKKNKDGEYMAHYLANMESWVDGWVLVQRKAFAVYEV